MKPGDTVRALCGGLLLLSAIARAMDFGTQPLNAAELKARQAASGDLIVVDVRKSGEYRTGHIPGAINIPHKKLAGQVEKLRKADAVVLYCFEGRRTHLAEQVLFEHDVENVYYLDGGLIAWRKAGYPVRTGWSP